jgi:hypothetical protein
VPVVKRGSTYNQIGAQQLASWPPCGRLDVDRSVDNSAICLGKLLYVRHSFPLATGRTLPSDCNEEAVSAARRASGPDAHFDTERLSNSASTAFFASLNVAANRAMAPSVSGLSESVPSAAGWSFTLNTRCTA